MKAQQGQEILYGVNVYGNQYPSYADSLAKSFLVELGMGNVSDFNSDLLIEVDKRLLAIGNENYYLDHYLKLISVFGLVANNTLSTTWKLVLADDMETWNIYLSYNDEIIVFHHWMWDDFYESYYPGSSPLHDLLITVADIIDLNIK